MPGFFAAKAPKVIGPPRIFRLHRTDAPAACNVILIFPRTGSPVLQRIRIMRMGDGALPFLSAAKAMQRPQQYRNTAMEREIRHKCVLRPAKPSQCRKRHIDCRCKDHRHHTGTNAAKNCVDSRILHQILQHRCNEQDNDKGRQHHAQRRAQRAPEAALRSADEGGHIDGQRAGCGLRHRNEAEELRLRSASRVLRPFPAPARSSRSRRRRTARRS